MQQTELLLRCKLLKQFGYVKLLKLAQQLPVKPAELSLKQLLALPLPADIKRRLKVVFDSELDQAVAKVMRQCHVISFFDEIYPPQLREIYRPPLILFALGNLQLLEQEIITIVGSRRPTNYSEVVLSQLIPRLVADDWVIASGLAVGVDTLAHDLTLAAGGATIAVVGNGLNQVYPSKNFRLQQLIAQQGLLLSEYLPDTPARPFRFPERNRILAGLCQNVLVTEAAMKSGSLITANLALDDNRNIYAVPGPITSLLSAGPNQLIAAGATPLVEYEIDLRKI